MWLKGEGVGRGGGGGGGGEGGGGGRWRAYTWNLGLCCYMYVLIYPEWPLLCNKVPDLGSKFIICLDISLSLQQNSDQGTSLHTM